MKKNKPKSFAEALRYWRQRRKLSPIQLARAADASPAIISRLEAGQRLPSYDVLCRLAKALDVSLSVFYTDSNHRQKKKPLAT